MSDSGSEFDPLDHFVQPSQSDAFDSASESSEKSSTSSHEGSRRRAPPRKRKITDNVTSSQSGLKRLKSSLTDDYRRLFNSTVVEIVSDKSPETDDQLQQSQIGVTVWSSEEKGAFFRALARRGRQDIRRIATDIVSKSESEVYVYSDILYKAAVHQQTYEIRKNLLDTSELAPALEIGGDCCAALDLAAEALSALQQNEEERAEKKRHKELALLTPRIARWIERCILVPEGGKQDVSQRIPAAGLLNLTNFLTLSKRFFMNSVKAEDNWRSYAKKTKSPSIMYTAFADIHALSVSITQRLVQSSLFFAMSRLRAESASGNYTPRSHVRRRDVTAALNVLGMKADAKAFWARVARNCKLRVYDKVRHRQVYGKRYSYAEVEAILSPNITSDQDSPEMTAKDASTSKSRRSRTSTESILSALEGLVSSDSLSIAADRPSALSNDEDLSVRSIDPIRKQNHGQDDRDRLRDAYAGALDQQASRNEERCLWEVLAEDPIERTEPLEMKLPKRPLPKRKDEDELIGWRDWRDYAADWEMYETPLHGSSFAVKRALKDDVDSAAELTGSASSSEGLVINESTEEEHDSDSDSDEDADGDSEIDTR